MKVRMVAIAWPQYIFVLIKVEHAIAAVDVVTNVRLSPGAMQDADLSVRR